MFEAWKKRLAQNAGEEKEEIVFKPVEEVSAPLAKPAPEMTNSSKGSSIEGNNIELKIVRPEGMDEIFTIADYLIDGCTVVLNLEILDKELIVRMLDFLNGVTYTTGGEIKNVSVDTYIITPSGININK